MKQHHTRVIPRDFFNEAKLLKCLGHLELCIVDRQCGGLPLTSEYDGEPFQIEQREHDGGLVCLNYRCYLAGELLSLYTQYNSKSAYPLLGEYRGQEYYLFDEQGRFMPNFGLCPEALNPQEPQS